MDCFLGLDGKFNTGKFKIKFFKMPFTETNLILSLCPAKDRNGKR